MTSHFALAALADDHRGTLLAEAENARLLARAREGSRRATRPPRHWRTGLAGGIRRRLRLAEPSGPVG